jgi:AmmeMemoRadiSam system protein A
MDYYLNLAKKAIEAYVKEGKEIEAPSKLSSEIKTKRAGVFVTIYKGKELRGCIGTYLPTQKNIAEEIINNARSASQDPRFSPLRVEELPKLKYEVSLLSKPKLISDKNKLNPKKDGVLVFSSLGRSGLLLPDLEGVETVDQQIAIACQKGGIDPFNDKLEIFSFQVEKHS